MDIQFDEKKMFDCVVEKLADRFENSEIITELERHLRKKIDNAMAEVVPQKISEFIDVELKNSFARVYQKTSSFGMPVGEPTTVEKELAKLMDKFWAEPVDKNGKPDSYSRTTRSQQLMARILTDDFTKIIERDLVNAAGSAKDALRASLREGIDKMLGLLFHVQSGDDQKESRRV